MRKITIIVETVAGCPGYFAANLDSQELCRSCEPLLASARELIQRGLSPDTALAMRHAGSDHDVLHGRLGALAGLTIEAGHDGVPRVRRWKAPPSVGLAPTMRSDAENAPSRPDDKMAIPRAASC